MPPELSKQPLLTIAIPTYNRSIFLRELLEVLLPQIAEVRGQGLGDAVDLLIADNASTDSTAEVTAWAEAQGLGIRVIRHGENIGSDANFVFCWNEARGRYFWLLGDDDVVRPGGLKRILRNLRKDEYDIVFLSPQAFTTDWRTEFTPDPWRREEQVITSARHMALLMNVGVTFISGYIVNRVRVLQVAEETPAAFAGTNLVQLSWSLPLLRHHRKSLVLWQRFLMGRAMNSGGYKVADVFGARFLETVHRLLPDKPRLSAIFPNYALRRWFPGTMVDLRRVEDVRYGSSGAEATLRSLFARNYRFWLFTWPAIRLPLPAAQVWRRGSDLLGKVMDWVQVPSDSVFKIRSRRR